MLNYSTASFISILAPATSGAVSGLPDNQTYTFGVRAVDNYNQIDANIEKKTANAGDLTPPLFLGFISSSALSETSLQLVFSRSTETDVSRYSVKLRRTSSGADYAEALSLPQVSSGNITATLINLLPATSYDILVKAIDTSGNLSTNTSALVKSTDITKMVVSWGAATDASPLFEYRVYYSTQSLSGKPFARTDTFPKTLVGGQIVYSNTSLISTTAVSTEISGLTSGTTYYFVVHAVDTSSNEDTNYSQGSALVPN